MSDVTGTVSIGQTAKDMYACWYGLYRRNSHRDVNSQVYTLYTWVHKFSPAYNT